MMQDAQDSTSQCHVKKKTVFLFKSPKENEADKFAQILEENYINCVTLPVLSFQFVNQFILKNHLASIHMFSAIIFTSVRSVEAVANFIQELGDAQDISKIQAFAIGPSTAEAARKWGFRPQGESSGNSQELAEFILQTVEMKKMSKPMLYPCSNIHRDTLMDSLKGRGVEVTEVISYETCPNKSLKEITQHALQTEGLPDFAVFFSPSGFHFTIAALSEDVLPLDQIKVIALGPTTYKSICDHRLTPFGMTKKPDPLSLLELLL